MQSEIDWGCSGSSTAVGLGMVEVLLVGYASNKVVDMQAAKRGWSDRDIVIGSLAMFTFVSFYGCIGFWSTSFGFRKGWEVYTVVMPGVGAAMGPVIASSR